MTPQGPIWFSGQGQPQRPRKEELRIVLLGKTGDGKSSAGNIILNDRVFPTKSSRNSVTDQCVTVSGVTQGRPLKVTDTLGFFDTDRPDGIPKRELVRCITHCDPGVHAFLIVLKVGTYTKQEMEVVQKIERSFGEDALKYSVVLFTRGDQLNDGQTIEDFVGESEELQELVDKCGGRCHVIDNKYWNQQQDEFRNNSVEIQKLLGTIEAMLRENGGNYYTNELLQMIEEDRGNMSPDDVFKKYLKLFAGISTGVLLGAFLGVVVLVGAVACFIRGLSDGKTDAVMVRNVARAGAAAVATTSAGAGAGVAETGAGISVAAGAGIAAGVVVGAAALTGAVVGGMEGYEAAEEAETGLRLRPGIE
ncbi:GTPase IMAP family member 7-like [Chanos chanos]|uniref:GTPase IMAP family member 7-like n=1 Tax=Chanos chanos TaxID=29144 RepID=A0A6J2VU26_CHACN|nr:GTPase IMAP family member 7-like [Chanos chanos]